MSRADRKRRHDQGEPPRPDALSPDYPRWAKFAFAAIIAVGLAAMAIQAMSHGADPDEFEHLHASWLWSQGVKPYEGFFEHHPPLFWYVLRPLVNSADKTDLMSLMVTSRAFTAVAATGVVVSCWWLFAALFGRGAAWPGTAFLALYGGVCPTVIELRPDVPSLLLLVPGTILMLHGLGIGRQRPGYSARLALVGGILVGTSVCLLTKSVLWTAGLIIALAVTALRRRARQTRQKHIVCLTAAVGGLAIPAVLQIVWILSASDWATFWHHNVTVNRALSWSTLKNLPVASASWAGASRWPMIAAPLAALGLGSMFGRGGPRPDARKAVALCLLASAILLILMGNGPWPQYCVPLHLLLAGLAGAGFTIAWDRLPSAGRVAAVSFLGIAGAVWILVMLILPTGPRQSLRQSVDPMQRVLDMSRPSDTYLAMQHWNPVYLMDADPKLFTKLVAIYNDQTMRQFAAAIETKRPQFILGFQMPVWTGQGRRFILDSDGFPAVKNRYYPYDTKGYILIRRD